MKSCFFIGQADTPEDIFPGLSTAIEHEIVHNGVTEFYVSNRGRFDLLAYRALALQSAGIRIYAAFWSHHAIPKLPVSPRLPPLMESCVRWIPLLRPTLIIPT